MVLAKPGSEARVFDALAVGRNIKTGDASLDFSGVYAQYQVLGQKAGTNEVFGADAAEVSVKVTGERTARRRVKINQEATITECRAPTHFGTWSAQFIWTLNTGLLRRLGLAIGGGASGATRPAPLNALSGVCAGIHQLRGRCVNGLSKECPQRGPGQWQVC